MLKCKVKIFFSDNRAGYICKCLEGLSGINCTFNKNDCNGTICENNGTCQDLINDYRCVCPDDYEGKNFVLEHLLSIFLAGGPFLEIIDLFCQYWVMHKLLLDIP